MAKKISEIQRIVLTAISREALTGAEISRRTGLLPHRGLAGALVALYKKKWVICPTISPITYRISDEGRKVLESHPSNRAMNEATVKFAGALKRLAHQ
jgi:DNA-binding PadR family transcriptional regulator